MYMCMRMYMYMYIYIHIVLSRTLFFICLIFTSQIILCFCLVPSFYIDIVLTSLNYFDKDIHLSSFTITLQREFSASSRYFKMEPIGGIQFTTDRKMLFHLLFGVISYKVGRPCLFSRPRTDLVQFKHTKPCVLVQSLARAVERMGLN